MTLNALDATLQAVCPSIMCPRYEPLKLLTSDGHRFILGGDGLYVEIHRPWVRAILKVVESPIPLPYGKPPAVFDLLLHRQALAGGLSRFIQRARSTSPKEHAAWLTFDPGQGSVGYVEPEIISQGSEHISYVRPDAMADSLPIVDCHSHGVMAAFFSSTDNTDDMSDDVKLAFVVGNLDKHEHSITMRFVAFGVTVDLSDWARSFLYDYVMNQKTDLDTNHGE